MGGTSNGQLHVRSDEGKEGQEVKACWGSHGRKKEEGAEAEAAERGLCHWAAASMHSFTHVSVHSCIYLFTLSLLNLYSLLSTINNIHNYAGKTSHLSSALTPHMEDFWEPKRCEVSSHQQASSAMLQTTPAGCPRFHAGTLSPWRQNS